MMLLLRTRMQAALRLLPLWLVTISFNLGLLGGFLALRAQERGAAVPAGSLTAVLWLGLALYLFLSGARQRATAFELVLPVDARRVWLVQALFVVLVGVAIAAASAGMLQLQARLLEAHGGFAVSPWSLFLHLGAGTALAVALLALPSPQAHVVPRTGRFVTWSIAVLVAVGTLIAALARFGAVAALVPLLLALLAAGVALRRLPAAFLLAPRALAPAPAASEAVPAASEPTSPSGRVDDAKAAARAQRTVRWTLARSLAGTRKEALAYPFLIFFGALLSGVVSAWSGDADAEDLRFLYLPMATYMLFVLTGPRCGLLHQLDPLPIPRGRLFGWLLLPHLVCFTMAYAAGAWIARLSPRTPDRIRLVEEGAGFRVHVPIWAREIAWKAPVPAVVAPWGETHTPRAAAFARGSTAVLYSPYDTPPGSSPRFVAYQTARAVRAVYGPAVAADAIAARALGRRANGTHAVGGDAGDATAAAAADPLAELRPRWAGPVMPIVLGLAVAPWFLLVAWLFRLHRADVSAAWRQRFVWGFVVVFLIVFVVQGALIVGHRLSPWGARAAVGIAARQLGGTAAGTAAAWCGAMALTAASAWLAAWQFRRMEVPARPERYTLVDWARETG